MLNKLLRTMPGS